MERWTNDALYATIILFLIAFYVKSWYLMIFVFAWLIISLLIHLIARFCHGRENKWHHKN
ncbi:MAG: hypothetical protein IMZ53_12530 [Thermoplasmata archaeon]|nr:hypothetical protein [Thermoplasmata archaeon]